MAETLDGICHCNTDPIECFCRCNYWVSHKKVMQKTLTNQSGYSKNW